MSRAVQPVLVTKPRRKFVSRSSRVGVEVCVGVVGCVGIVRRRLGGESSIKITSRDLAQADEGMLYGRW